ncbi:MAG: hypothetical protein IKS15_03575 [Opitutales bacterium]|nr:hypothetical protein [Opitutales bacterium]
MKKIITLTILAAASALFFACSPKQDAEKLTIKDAANAAPENSSVFIAFNFDQNLQKDFYAQKGAKEYWIEYANGLSQFLSTENMPEELKPILTKEFFSDAAKSMIANPEGIFFAMALTQEKGEEADCKFIVLKNSLAVQKTREILEQKKLEKVQSANFEFYKPKSAKLVVAVKSDMLVVADNEAEAEKVFANLKAPQEKSFAKTPQFEKLMGLKKDSKCVIFADSANGEANIGAAYIAMDFSVSDYSAAMKILPKNGKFYGDENSKNAWLGFCKNKLPKNAILKNSMQNSSIALALAVPEISPELAGAALLAAGAEANMAVALLQKIGIKNLYLSCGEIEPNTISKIQSTMQPPEIFIKIACQDTDAFFKDETMAQLLNSPLVAPLQFGEKTIYSSMANLKIAQISKESAIIATMTDMEKMMSLANGKGATLEGNKDAAALFAKLPSGNTLEMFVDGKSLQNLAIETMNMAIEKSAEEAASDEEKEKIKRAAFWAKMQTAAMQMTKKNVCALGVKLDESEISAELFGEFEYDYELGAKLMKEAK